uniref:Uncharacterized protein n=1 Tax=Arundo donax TaxID=35708 RepID=A0A0A9C4D3_ARUDO
MLFMDVIKCNGVTGYSECKFKCSDLRSHNKNSVYDIRAFYGPLEVTKL